MRGAIILFYNTTKIINSSQYIETLKVKTVSACRNRLLMSYLTNMKLEYLYKTFIVAP